jgi:hypothetical protein
LGEGWTLSEVCRAFDVCRNTVVRVRTRFAEGGVDAVLSEKRQMRYRAALTGTQQAHLSTQGAALVDAQEWELIVPVLRLRSENVGLGCQPQLGGSGDEIYPDGNQIQVDYRYRLSLPS